MIVRNGVVIHHRDCTYCQYRRNVPKPIQPKKRRGKLDMLEQCELTGLEIAPPGSINRVCAAYRQIGCDCPSCSAQN